MYKSVTPSSSLLCEFDFLDNARTGFPPLLEMPNACNNNFSVLKIDTSSNNWFLSDDIMDLGHTLIEITSKYDIIYAICFSMGIMPALLLSNNLNLQKIMAFSPIISIYGDEIPDNRLRQFRSFVHDTELRHLWKQGNHNIQGSLCFDPRVKEDRMQARFINSFYPALQPVAMPFGGHPCIHVVKEVMGFHPFQNLVLNNKFDPHYLRTLHKESRQKSNIYLKHMKLSPKTSNDQ